MRVMIFALDSLVNLKGCRYEQTGMRWEKPKEAARWIQSGNTLIGICLHVISCMTACYRRAADGGGGKREGPPCWDRPSIPKVLRGVTFTFVRA